LIKLVTSAFGGMLCHCSSHSTESSTVFVIVYNLLSIAARFD
jgi:hypothetical protein